MKSLRIITAFALLFAILLGSMPDSVLDVFHKHQHTHDCGPVTGDQKTLEKEHIHCKNPDLFFRHFLPSHFTFTIVASSYPMVYHAIAEKVTVVSYHLLPGRAPPVA
jgi:hypothetical protein